MSRVVNVVAALALAACAAREAPAPAVAALTPAAMRDTLTSGLKEYAAAAQAFDSARVMALIADDPDFRFVEGQTITDRQGFATLVSQAFGTLKAFEARFNFDSMAVITLSPTSAVTVVPYVDTFTDKAGAVSTVRGVVSWMWAERNGRWQMMGAHASPAAPEAGK